MHKHTQLLFRRWAGDGAIVLFIKSPVVFTCSWSHVTLTLKLHISSIICSHHPWAGMVSLRPAQSTSCFSRSVSSQLVTALCLSLAINSFISLSVCLSGHVRHSVKWLLTNVAVLNRQLWKLLTDSGVSLSRCSEGMMLEMRGLAETLRDAALCCCCGMVSAIRSRN